MINKDFCGLDEKNIYNATKPNMVVATDDLFSVQHVLYLLTDVNFLFITI